MGSLVIDSFYIYPTILSHFYEGDNEHTQQHTNENKSFIVLFHYYVKIFD